MQPFRKLGPYDLVERLAVGGMAEIYVARARGVQGFEKEYVLKLIHPKYVGDTEFIRMLVDEAKLVGQLHHSNIAQVIDLGVDGEAYFILMEYVRGKDVYQILNTAWDQDLMLPIDMCIHIARGMCAGLYYAHTKNDANGRPLNIVHRDISPQNVLLSYQGEVKLLDFGVAKAALGARPETRAGIIKGKFRYMSPEQSWGEKLDGRSDLFSVGLCLYEMLTGVTAYDDDGDMQKTLLRMREAQFTPPSRHRPDISPELESLLMRALARERGDRYATCHEFDQALAHYLHTHHAGFTPMKVMQVMKLMFPEQTRDVHVPEPTGETKAEIPRIGTDELEAFGFQLIDEGPDTSDMTLRQSVVRGEAASPNSERPVRDSYDSAVDDSFAEEMTELYHQSLHDPGEQTARDLPTIPVSSMSDDQMAKLRDAEPATVDLRAGTIGPENRQEMSRRDARRAQFVTPTGDDLRVDSTTTKNRAAPRGGHSRDPRRDTIADLIERHLPPSAADRALVLHQKIVDLLNSDDGRKILIPVLGLVLGLFVLLVLVVIIF